MKIAYNPKTAAVITTATAANDDILFDLNARKVWAKGLRMGADWADISSKPSSLKNPAAITFKDVNGKVISYDGSVATDLTAGTYIANRLATARKLWGQSFDGTADVNGSLSGTGNITPSSAGAFNIGSNSLDYRYGYFQWLGSKTGTNLRLAANNSDNQIVLHTNGNVGIGTGYPAYKLDVIGDTRITGSIRNLAIGGGIYWNPYVESATDSNDAASITLVRAGVAGGTTLVLSQMNDANDTIQFKTNDAARLYHNSNFILTSKDTKISGSTITINGSSLKLNIANWDTAYNFVSTITGTDTDNVINKWDEIVNFLAGITEDNKLNTLLNSKLSIQQLSAKDILTTKTNNALFWVNTVGTASSITTGPFTDHPYALLSVTNYSQNDTNGKFFYRSRLAFSSVGDIKVSSCHHQGEYKQDDAWYNVLTSKNSGISGSTIKLNGTSITVYSSGTADGRYVKKSGDTMTGALNFANGTWNIVGDDVAMGDCNIAGCLGIKGLNGSPGLAFYNSSNTLLSKLIGTANQFQRVSGNNVFNILDTSSTYVSNGKGVINGTTITQVDNADTVGGEHASAFTRIVGRHIIHTNDTAPYNYIYLFRIANSNTNSTLDCEIDFRSRYHSAKLEIRIAVGGLPYGADHSVISIVKKVINGRSCNFWVLPTVQSSGYNYYDIYYQSRGWDTGSYDIILRDGGNSKLVFEHKGIKLDALPPNASVVNNQWVMWNDIAGKPSSFTPAEHNHDGRYLRLSGQDTMQGNLNLFSYGSSYIGRGSGDKSGEDFTEANIVIRSWYGISFKSFDDKVRTYIDTRTGNIGTKGKFIGNLTGNATSATKVIVNQHTTNDINYPLVWSNQSNTSNVTENQLYKSWADLYYNPKNKKLVVGGSVSTAYINATGTVTSAGFKHSAVTKNANQYVLTADGGYTFLNQASNELAHEFDVNITVTSEWTDIKDFYGGNQSFLTQPGTYIVQVYYKDASADGMYEGYFSGIMSWYTGKTNSNNADEIVLHRVGHAYANTIYLRTRESLSSEANPYTKLQISANSDLKQHTYKFKFKRIC